MRFGTNSFRLRIWQTVLAVLCSTAYSVAQDKGDVQLVASPFYMRTLYRGIDNAVEVAVPNVKCEDLKISISQGALAGTGCLFSIKPGNENILRMEARWEGKDSIVSSFVVFRVEDLPDPTPYFAGLSVDNDSLSVASARIAQGVIAKVEGFGFDLKIQIIGYRMILTRGECKVLFDGISNEAKATEAMFNALGTSQRGDNLAIKEIRVKWPSGRISHLKKLEFVLY